MTEHSRIFTSRDGLDTWEVSPGYNAGRDYRTADWPPTVTCTKGYGRSIEVRVDADTGEIVFDVQDDDPSVSWMVNMPMEAWTAFMEEVHEWRRRCATHEGT